MKGDVIKNTCTRVPCIPIGPPMAKNVRYRAEFAANAVESGRICGYTYIDMCSTRWTCLLAVARLLGLPSGIGRGSRLVNSIKRCHVR